MKLNIFGALMMTSMLAACAAQQVPTTVVMSSGGMAPSPYSVTTLPDGEHDFVDNVQDRVFFAFNSAKLTRAARSILQQQAAWLLKYPDVSILVAGNTDPRGSEPYNFRLGQRRADAVRDELLADGVAAARIRTMSYGKDCPLVAGNSDNAYQQDRNEITSVEGFNPQACRQ